MPQALIQILAPSKLQPSKSGKKEMNLTKIESTYEKPIKASYLKEES